MGRLKINGREIRFKKGQTILEVARNRGIYIPSLCTLPELPPFGACRLCLVEVNGTLVTSCTTPAEEGMIVSTESDEIRELRREILKLILSEHPSSCIICDERERCEEYCPYPKEKVGRVTGCAMCPKREGCEIRELANTLEVKDIPLDYKNLELEREDPFFGRDHNLCILCGRCVRVCQDIRGVGAIAFINRGNETRVGTAFHKTLLEGGCIFCGACIDVCPTGALSTRKWYGRPDAETKSVCMLCSLGCDIKIESKWGRVVDVSPNGHACVLGRFCVPPLVNSQNRLKLPLIRKNGTLSPVTWEEALSYVAKSLKEYQPEEVGFIVSPFLTNEASYLLQKLSRVVIGTNNIGTTCGPFKCTCTLKRLERSNLIIIIGLDTNLLYSVVNVSINRAKRRGARIISVGAVESLEGKEILKEEEVTKEGCAIVYGESVSEQANLLISKAKTVLPIYGAGNAQGVCAIGALPGYRSNNKDLEELWKGKPLEEMLRKVKALYLTEALPSIPKNIELLILQDSYSSPLLDRADVVLPAAVFTEQNGTIISSERRMKRVRSAVSPPGLAKEDRWIIHQLAKRMHGFTLKREKEFLTLEKMPPRFHPSKFHPSKNIPRYRGTRITDEVEDLRTLLASRGYDDV